MTASIDQLTPQQREIVQQIAEEVRSRRGQRPRRTVLRGVRGQGSTICLMEAKPVVPHAVPKVLRGR